MVLWKWIRTICRLGGDRSIQLSYEVKSNSDNKQLIAPVHHYMHQNLQLTGGRVAQLGPTIGTHVGPGVVGVVFVAKE